MYEPEEKREIYRERSEPAYRDGPREPEVSRDYVREERRIERPVPVEPYNYRAVQAAWFVIALIDALIAIRFTLKLLGASPEAPFVSFVYGVSSPLVAPFRGIFPDTGQGYFIFEPASLVGLVVYALIGWAVVALIRITTAPRRL